jgi:hypothetical protein
MFEADSPPHPLPERADVVEPCVDRFVVGELDPTGQLAVSRTTPMSLPGLALKLGRRLDSASNEQGAGVALAVRRVLAYGYLGHVELEGTNDIDVDPGRPARDIWDFWAPSCRDDLEGAGVPEDWAKGIRRVGSTIFIADLKALGLTRFLGGSKLNQWDSSTRRRDSFCV